ncbi:hypothetical protein [Lignipirellula cremea]|uniref:hypothetical protein n=1 Tax=Lignipirellula cremea TaxID=2528010 RepID=UPI0018D21107|nr:hypothetical protein [Lignipirellula cremea]
MAKAANPKIKLQRSTRVALTDKAIPQLLKLQERAALHLEGTEISEQGIQQLQRD